MRSPRLWVPALAAVLSLAMAGPALAAVGQRPTSGSGPLAYAAPEAPPLVSAHAVVHYVPSGGQAPAAADANGNGLPDYVEQVSNAAERSLAFYASHGFLSPLPDSAGPDQAVDIYVDRMPDGFFGESWPAQEAEPGGGFVVVSNRLATSVLDPDGGVEITVAHELFHITQFSYFAGLELPNATIWADEGSAVAMSMTVYPEIRDQANQQHLDNWLKETWLPLYYVDGADGCLTHCYGGAWWWLWLWQLDPRLLPDYYGRLYGYEKDGRPVGLGVAPLSETLARDGHGSLESAFTTFASDLYRRGLARPTYSAQSSFAGRFVRVPVFLRPAAKKPTTAVVSGLSAQYVAISLPAGARSLDVSLASDSGPPPKLTLILGGVQGRALSARPLLVSRQRQLSSTHLRIRLRGPAERKAVLVLASGRRDPALYRLRLQSLR